MSKAHQLLEQYMKAVRFPGVSGFEVLELLDLRSNLAALESELGAEQRAQLEEAESVFLRNAPLFYESVAALSDLAELRRRAAAPCSHWWWYLEKLAQREPVKA